MDVDLQDPPELIPQMARVLAVSDNDVVAARRLTREHEPKIRSFFSNRFYTVMNHVSKVKIVSGVRDFRMMRRNVVTAILSMPEYNRFSKGIFDWIGFKTKYIDYNHTDRVAGKTHWSFKQLLSYSLDGIMDFSNVPLATAVWFGIILLGVSIAGLLIMGARVMFGGIAMPDALLYTLIIMLVSGIQLTCLGIVGDYIGKIYLETKQRPHYIIRDKH